MNNISKVNFQGEKTEKPKTTKSTKGWFSAFLGGNAANIAFTAPTGLVVLSRLDKINDLPQDKIDIIHNTYETVLKETGLADKGVKLIKLADKKVGLWERFKITISAPIKGNFDDMVKNGANAYYNPSSNRISMPQKQLSTCGFHEIGHAMNANLSKWSARLQKMRPAAMTLPVLIMLYCALTTNKKPDKDGKISKADKTNNFIRNNGGKLAFLTMTPMLLEEGMASIKGQKLANKFLKDKNLIQTVKRNHCWAYLSYLGAAATAGFAVYTVRKIKDNIQAKKEAKLKAAHK